MNITKKIFLFFLMVLITCLGVSYLMPGEEKKGDLTALRIGSGDDITGLLLKEIVQNRKSIDSGNLHISGDTEVFFDFTFKDC